MPYASTIHALLTGGKLRRWSSALAVVVAGALAGAASGGQNKATATAATPKAVCKTAALAKQPKLPARFPKPAEVTFTSAQQAGPSLIVQGYYEADLVSALNEYKDAVKSAGYTNLKTEHDAHDAEINFAGGGSTGQIALRETCKEANTTFLRITIRPGAGIRAKR